MAIFKYKAMNGRGKTIQGRLVAVNVNAYYQSMVVGAVLLVAIVVDRLRVQRLERTAGRFAKPHPHGAVADAGDDDPRPSV